MRQTTMDGKPVVATVEQERGHPVVTLDVEIRPGASRTLRLTFDEPRVSGAVQTLSLPMVRPLAAAIAQPRC